MQVGRVAQRLWESATTSSPTAQLYDRERARLSSNNNSSATSTSILVEANLIKPLALPAIVAGNATLRSFQLRVQSLCRNYVTLRDGRGGGGGTKATRADRVADDAATTFAKQVEQISFTLSSANRRYDDVLDRCKQGRVGQARVAAIHVA